MDYRKESTVNYEVPNREETDAVIINPNKYEQRFGQTMNQFPKFPAYHKSPAEFNKYIPNNSAPVSVNSSMNSVTNGSMSVTSPTWKQKSGNPQNTVLSANEIKDKVLQFRSPKFIGSGKNIALVTKTSGVLQELTPKK